MGFDPILTQLDHGLIMCGLWECFGVPVACLAEKLKPTICMNSVPWKMYCLFNFRFVNEGTARHFVFPAIWNNCRVKRILSKPWPHSLFIWIIEVEALPNNVYECCTHFQLRMVIDLVVTCNWWNFLWSLTSFSCVLKYSQTEDCQKETSCIHRAAF